MPDEFLPQELHIREWFERAEDDEKNVQSILKHRDGTPNAVCFLSQQMSEKHLKAYLVARKQWFPKIHSIDKLLELCCNIDDSFNALKRDAVYLADFYTQTRYPGDYPEFTWQEAEQAYEAATRIKEFVSGQIKK
jgi:HEPN domain-containing protein